MWVNVFEFIVAVPLVFAIVPIQGQKKCAVKSRTKDIYTLFRHTHLGNVVKHSQRLQVSHRERTYFARRSVRQRYVTRVNLDLPNMATTLPVTDRSNNQLRTSGLDLRRIHDHSRARAHQSSVPDPHQEQCAHVDRGHQRSAAR